MKRIPVLVAVLMLTAVLLASCASSGKTNEPAAKTVIGTEDSPFVKQFLDAGASIQVNDGFISLKRDLHLPAGTTLVLDTGETWKLNLNGHTVFRDKGDDTPAVIVSRGTLFVVTGRAEKYQGGIFSSDGLCIRVEKGGALDVQAGTISGGDYAIEVMEGGTLRVLDGRIQADVLPLLVHFGWVGSLTGGLFSRYDDSYYQALTGEAFASTRFMENDRDFARKWPEGFRVVKGHRYSGISYLKLSSAGGYSACFRLYREQDVDDVLRTDDPMPAYEWFMYPGQVMTKEFMAGRYILMVAEGYDWTEENAFGDGGIYWSMEPYDFEDGQVYAVDRRNGTADTKEGFLKP